MTETKESSDASRKRKSETELDLEPAKRQKLADAGAEDRVERHASFEPQALR
jgi:hypothetical protein